MTEETKKDVVEETTTTVADTVKPNDGVDYASELAKVKKQLGQAEHTIVELKKKKDETGEPQIDIDEIVADIKEQARQEVEKVKNELTADTVEDHLASISNDPAERELIKLHYEKTINKTGTSRAAILADLQNAKVLANKPRFDKLMSEANRSADTKASIPSGAASGHQTDSPTELSAAEEKAIQAMAQRTGKPVDEIRLKLIANKNN
jgi:hypothetical protein